MYIVRESNRKTAFITGQMIGAMKDIDLPAFQQTEEWEIVEDHLQNYATQIGMEESVMVGNFEQGYEYRQGVEE